MISPQNKFAQKDRDRDVDVGDDHDDEDSQISDSSEGDDDDDDGDGSDEKRRLAADDHQMFSRGRNKDDAGVPSF